MPKRKRKGRPPLTEKRCEYCDATFALPKKGRSNDHWRWKWNPSRSRGYFTCAHRERERDRRDSAKARAKKNEQTLTIREYLQNTIHSAKGRAYRMAREFSITIDDLMRLWDEQNGLCAYTGFPMTHHRGSRMTNASIERIDSTRGYTPDNICLIQTKVNSMKMNTPLGEFIEMAEAIVARRETLLSKYIRHDARHDDEASFS